MKITRSILKMTRRTLIHIIMLTSRVFPIDNKKIVFVSYYGSGFGDNGKAIANRILNRQLNLKLVWAALPKFRNSIPSTIYYVKYRSIRYYWELATASVWLDNARKTTAILKRKKQYYIQLWHGCHGLKKCEQDAEGCLSIEYVADAKYDSKMVNLITSGSNFFTELVKRAFWYDGEILECGTPRLDTMFHPTGNLREIVRKKLGISIQKNIILYAPTFRVDGNVNCYNLDFNAILLLLQRKTSEDWVFAVRFHPNIAKKACLISYSNKIFDATSYPDLYELIPAVDIVVSDYSSLLFEAGLIKKPAFIFATDIKDYVDDRGFYFDIYKLPFPLAQTNEEFLQNIMDFDIEKYKANIDSFYSALKPYENGASSDAIIDRILKVINA